MNIVQITGRLTKDPELRYSNNGTAFTTVNIAVDDYDFKAKEKIAYFFPVVIWGKAAENLAKYQSKGSKILVKGKLRARSYDAKDGTKRYVTEIVADTNGGIEYMSSVNKDGASNSYGNGQYNQDYNNGYNNYNNGYNNQNNGGYNQNPSYNQQNQYNQNPYSSPQTSAPTQNNTDESAFKDAFAGFGGDDFFPIDDGDVPF